jgi:N-acetylglucosamine-6-sulfatase
LLVIATALGATSGVPSAAQEGPGKPNIVYVVTDDMTYTDLQYMPHVQDLLVTQGMSFSEAYAPLSSCCPSRASVLTGKYPHNHGVWSNMGPTGGAPGFKKRGNEASTIATWLKDAGYTTALFGKYLNDYTVETYIPRGWDRWFAKLDPRGAANYDYDV